MKLSLLSILLLLAISAGAQTANKAPIKTNIGNVEKRHATVAELCANPVITHSKTGYAVMSCTVSYIKKGQKDLIGPFAIKGGNLAKDGKCWFADLQPGDSIFIDDIKISCSDCTEEMTAAPMNYIIQ